MEGRYCRLEPLDPARHAAALFAANALDTAGRSWTYLPYGPFENLTSYHSWMEQFCAGTDPLFHAIITGAQGAVGVPAICASSRPKAASRLGI